MKKPSEEITKHKYKNLPYIIIKNLTRTIDLVDQYCNTHHRKTKLITSMFLLVCTCVFIYAGIQMYYNCTLLNSYDLSIFSQSLWSTKHGGFYENTIEGWMINKIRVSHFGLHNQPLLMFFQPIYHLFESPLALLITQILILPLGAAGIYLLSVLLLKSHLSGLIFSLFYIFHPIFMFNILDFHPESMVIVFIPWAVYFLEKNKSGSMLIFVLLILFTKENMALFIVFFGIFIAFRKKSLILASAVSCAGLFWFVFSIYIVIPYFAGGSYHYIHRYDHFGDNFFSVAIHLLTNPVQSFRFIFSGEKLIYLFNMLRPFFFFPLFVPVFLLLVIPELAQNLMSNMDIDLFLFGRTSLTMLPVFTCATLYFFKMIKNRLNKGNLVAICISLCMLVNLVFLYGRENTFNLYQRTQVRNDGLRSELSAVSALINSEDSISVDYHLMHRFCNRNYIFAFSNQSLQVDKVLVNKAFYNPSLENDYSNRVRRVMESGYFKTLYEGDSLLLLERMR